MDIIIDNSGYHLRNLGDVAMLQGAVKRIERVLPAAKIGVICSDPERLAGLLPNTEPLSNHLSHLAEQLRLFPVPHRWLFPSIKSKVIARDRILRVTQPKRLLSKIERASGNPVQAWLDQLKPASAIIATGGGYLTDSFDQHASGVLTTLSLAQALGKPTALFGQGLGPIHNQALLDMVKAVLCKCHFVGLREPLGGTKLLQQLGIFEQIKSAVTGDDALELIPDSTSLSNSRTIGLTIRLTDYSGISEARLPFLQQELRSITASLAKMDYCPLPIDLLSSTDNDETHALRLLSALPLSPAYQSPTRPSDVIRMAANCRATITGSYHSALFSIAQGVPVIALQSNAYYSGKFSGLEALFPGSVRPYDPTTADPGELLAQVQASIQTEDSTRQQWVKASQNLCANGREAYQTFFQTIQPATLGGMN